MADETSWDFGQMQMTFEAPDLLIVRSRPGPLAADEVRRIAEVVERIVAQQKRQVHMLGDITGVDMGSEVRAVAGKAFRPEWFQHSVFIGASMGMRVALRSIQLVGTFIGTKVAKLDFASTLEEGRARIERGR